MVDYAGPSGTGTILIRDLGWDIQFHAQAGSSSTYAGTPGFPWSGTVNGVGVSGRIANYSNREWRHVATYTITYNQQVRFGMDNTTTAGFGNWTSVYAQINRATVPAAPTPIGITNVTHTQFRYQFSGNSDGGSPIREWQIGYGYAGLGVQFTAPSNGTIDVGQFTVGSKIGIWSRGRNDVGWSAWSSEMQVQLLRGLKLKVSGTWRDVIPYVKIAGVWRACEPFVKVAGTWRASGQ